MELSDLVVKKGIVASLKAKSKKQALQELSNLASEITGIDPRHIFEILQYRERLGSTGLGHGVAIPHGKFRDIQQLHGIFARLKQPIEFDATDGQPVDLIFLLLAPEGAGADHLKALARVSRLMRNPSMTEKLRGSDNVASIFSIITEPAASHAA